MEELKPCPFCKRKPEIMVRSFGDNRDPCGNGSQIEIWLHCCTGTVFMERRYYKHGYKMDSDHHKKIIAELKTIVITTWNTRPSPWIAITPETKIEEGWYLCKVKYSPNYDRRVYYYKNGRWQTPGTEVTHYRTITPIPGE